MVEFKRTSQTESWVIADNKRDTDNPVGNYLLADSSGAEASELSMIFYLMVLNLEMHHKMKVVQLIFICASQKIHLSVHLEYLLLRDEE